MDRETRNRIQRATQDARALLEREYAEQLAGTFDLHLDGTIASTSGGHLDAGQRLVRAKLVTAVEHLRAAGHGKDAVAAYVREAAFTTLNRFVALKMLEARGLVQECLSRGEESSGFKEFVGLAPGLVQLPDHGYRLYIESLFDEIGREVRVLFDRRDPASLLWPRRQPLLDLLAILNAAELASVWGEDETIGWVYQYLNSDEERRQMRAESQAPRNSRELAVRNQFFTPRYVVQFLTDNTLGRIWYEMRRGDTKLRDLGYLVRRPNEVFLADGEEPPAMPEGNDEDLSQEELLRGPVYVPFRAKKDPRDIRVLDPACGSGHFLLYAFDLLLMIYEETWTDETAPSSEVTGKTLREDYPDLEALRAAAPGLILRHNLHGIDIDARCAQIAALALWLRAQRDFKDFGIGRDARPPIQKTNIVMAEPMPGDPELRREFIATLDPRLGRLVQRVFDRMELAGEAGSLLQVEDDIRDAVRTFHGEHGELFRATDEERWRRAEEEVLRALRAYGERAINGRAFQRRLFAEDAARGLGLIDLSRHDYDVVLMNPPFGLVPPAVYTYLINQYGGAHNDVFAAFVLRGCRLSASGRVGAITSRGFLVAPRMADFRLQTFLPKVELLADLGGSVMDDAFVESCAYVLEGGGAAADRFLVFDLRGSGVQPLGVANWPRPSYANRQWIGQVPKARILYSLPRRVNLLLQSDTRFEPTAGTAREGMKTFDNFRFLRLRWEVAPHAVGPGSEAKWSFLAKGGAFSFYLGTFNVLVNWADDGQELQEINRQRNGSTAQVRQASTYWRRAGVTYSGRSAKGFSARALPEGLIISGRGPAILSESDVESEYLLGWANSRLIRALIHLQASASYFATGIIKKLPWVVLRPDQRARLIQAVQLALSALLRRASALERSPYFVAPFVSRTVDEGLQEANRIVDAAWSALSSAMVEWDAAVDEAYGVESRRWATDLLSDGGNGAEDWERDEDSDDDEDSGDSGDSVALPDYAGQVLSYVLGVAFGKWDPRRLHERDALLADISAFTPLSPDALGGAAGASSPAILADDPGADSDIVAVMENAASSLFPAESNAGAELAAAVGVPSIRTLIRGSVPSLFGWHIERYSGARRRAPIYWQLSTPSASYSVWLYYPRFTRDTLYRILNDYVTPKLKHEERKLINIIQDAGPNPSASQRKEVDAQERFVDELRALREEVARVAPLWNPNLNDGVIINFAPLWRLVPQDRSWQKECKAVWDRLVAREHDWAHLAMHLWPERVVPKCAIDRSLAIAHGLEEVFWKEDPDGKWKPKKVAKEVIERLIAERTSAAVKAALDDLLRAPAPTATSGGRRRSGERRAEGNGGMVAASRSRGKASAADSSVDEAAVAAVRDAIAVANGGASKAEVMEATGISSSDWNAAIKALLAQGAVIKTGAARGTRYQLAAEQETA